MKRDDALVSAPIVKCDWVKKPVMLIPEDDFDLITKIMMQKPCQTSFTISIPDDEIIHIPKEKESLRDAD